MNRVSYHVKVKHNMEDFNEYIYVASTGANNSSSQGYRLKATQFDLKVDLNLSVYPKNSSQFDNFSFDLFSRQNNVTVLYC